MEVKYDLAVIIIGRREEFQARTIEGVLANKRGKTQVIAVLDEKWSDPGIKDHPDLTVLKLGIANGQRKATNLGARLANARFFMKLDAHCIVSEGFDLELLKAFKELGEDIVQIPKLYNLHAFNWKCKKCGNEWYQSPTPTQCQNSGEGKGRNMDCDSKEFERVMIWQPRKNRDSECYRFDTTLHFQYARHDAKKQKGDYIETMSAQGSCFVVKADNYWKWKLSDEEFGSWGQQGTEVACKTWLSGNRLITNRLCWYAHLFRTQGGDFGFPYPQDNKQVEHARKYSRDLFFNNKWEHQIRPLSWLVEKFPQEDWYDPKNKEILNRVLEAGKKFNNSIIVYDPVVKFFETKHEPTKGIIYYTDNRCPLRIAKRVQNRLKEIGLPIVSASLKSMDFGKNIHVKLERSPLTMFKQILTALENSDSDIVYFCEHDVIYDPSHFDFTPPDKDTWYYNTNVLRVRWEDGFAVKVDDLKQVSGICVYRETAIKHYKKRIELVESFINGTNKFCGRYPLEKYFRRMGYEPGTNPREERVDDNKSATWESKKPNLDIRHSTNLTSSRWSKEQFRNEKFTRGWTESYIDLK